MPSIYPAQSKENSLNPNLLGLLIGPTKALLFSRYQLPAPSQDKTTHNISHNFHSGRVRGRRDRFTLVRIRVQHGKDRPTRRIVCDIVRQRISPQVDISVSSPSNGNPDG